MKTESFWQAHVDTVAAPSVTPAIRPATNSGWVMLGGLMLLAVAMRLFRLDARGFWTDEFWTLEAIGLPVRDLVGQRLAHGHFPTYFILLKFWSALFGQSECALRGFSLLLNVASVPLIFWAARRAWSERCALWAALFYVCHERSLWAAQEARPYGLIMLAAAASMHALLTAIESGRRRWRLAYAAWTMLGLFTHVLYSCIYLAQLGVVGVWLTRRRGRRVWAACLLGPGLVVLPALGVLQVLSRQAASRQLEIPQGLYPLGDWCKGLLEIFWGQYEMFAADLKYLMFPAIAMLVTLAWRARSCRTAAFAFVSGRASHAPCFALFAAWGLSCLVGVGLSALIIGAADAKRYISPGLGGATLLMGLAVGALDHPLRRRALASACLALLILPDFGLYRWPGHQVREAIRFVAGHRRPNEPVLICKETVSRTMAEYYGLGVEPVPVPQNETDPEMLRQLVARTVGQVNGFWLILYKEGKSPVFEVVEQWRQPGFRKIADRKLNQVRLCGYRRVGD
ncbi:MAG: glycosyltransferase family 39 protein [bacterium]|nr:glycosyltransferase family 39 protein [bacterium]